MKSFQLIRERTISCSSTTQETLSLTIDDLDADTLYRLTVAAQNDVGLGPSSSVEVR